MATSVLTNLIPGFTAGLTLAAGQYKAVKFGSTAGTVVAVTSSTDVAVGFVQNDPAAGEPALVAGPGSIAIALAGVTDLAVGDRVGWNSTGQVDDTKTRKIGIALDASTALNDYVRIAVHGYMAA